MIVEVISRTEEELEDYDWRDKVEIKVDGQTVFYVADDEPEDSNLSRSFSDCFSIGDLMKKAYEAGKNGEDFELI